MHDLLLFYPTGHEAHYQRGHPERPGRVEAIRAALENAGLWEKYPKVDPVSIPLDVLHTVHEPTFLNTLKSACQQGRQLDKDTYLTPASWQLALNSAGGALAIAKAVWRREAKRGFALTRPPGHHATSNQAMGFCLLNNIAIATEHLVQYEKAEKLAIVDIDLHHGNGTHDIFYKRGDVFFFSIHQFPLYPGTGILNETGAGPGEFRTANLPLPPNSGDVAILSCLQSIIIPLLDTFKPQMLLISIGFDAHWRDPLGSLLVSTDCFGKVISKITRWADTNCDGRIALFLEGGYDLEVGADSALAVTQALLWQAWDDPLGQSPQGEMSGWESILEQSKKIWGLKT